MEPNISNLHQVTVSCYSSRFPQPQCWRSAKKCWRSAKICWRGEILAGSFRWSNVATNLATHTRWKMPDAYMTTITNLTVEKCLGRTFQDTNATRTEKFGYVSRSGPWDFTSDTFVWPIILTMTVLEGVPYDDISKSVWIYWCMPAVNSALYLILIPSLRFRTQTHWRHIADT